MTRRKKPSNKTIVVEAKKGNVTITLPTRFDGERLPGHIQDEPFMSPIDFDKIQPEQKDGNLCIKFPD